VNEATPKLVLEGAREHNLKNLSVAFPLQRLTVVTGVSGSGKSTLVQDVLVPALLRHFGKATESPGDHDRLLGADWLAEAVFVDQSPIGKAARSVARWAKRHPARAGLALALVLGIPLVAGLGGFVLASLPKLQRVSDQE